jgi:hypothetical protein
MSQQGMERTFGKLLTDERLRERSLSAPQEPRRSPQLHGGHSSMRKMTTLLTVLGFRSVDDKTPVLSHGRPRLRLLPWHRRRPEQSRRHSPKSRRHSIAKDKE